MERNKVTMKTGNGVFSTVCTKLTDEELNAKSPRPAEDAKKKALNPIRTWLLCCVAWLVAGVAAQAGSSAGPATNASGAMWPPLLYAAEGASKILIYDRAGQIAWEYPAPMARDVWRLPNGHVLFCYNERYQGHRHDNPSGVMEVTPDKQVVFHFATTGQVWSCQRLANSNTLVGAASQGKLLEVNPQGVVGKTITVRNPPGHSCMRYARGLANGHFIVAEESAGMVREYGADGACVREFAVAFPPFAAVRLSDGHTVISGRTAVVEVDAAGKTVWRLDAAEVPQLGIRWFTGIQVLPDGHLLVCNAGGKVVFFEITRDPAKQIVWQSNIGPSTIPLGHGIQRLDLTDRDPVDR